MTVDQLDELIRKYLSTGVAMVLVLVAPATAPNGGTARPDAGTHSTAAPSTAQPTPAPRGHSGANPPSTPTSKPTSKPASKPTSTAPPARDDGPTAAATYRWGPPNRQDDFTADLAGWGLYDGTGHAGKGTRSPGAATVADGVLTISGDAEGTTEGMAWEHGKGQKYGRWEGRVRAPAGDPTYNALLLLWPDAEDFPGGGEFDFMEMTDPTRQSTNAFLHHGKDNAQEHGVVKVDATQWHNWAVEWTPKSATTYVDGKPWWHTDNTAALPLGPMHLCIQLDWFPQNAARKAARAVTPSQMQVDWVRQYPLDATSRTSTPAPTSDNSAMRDVVQRTLGW